MAEYMPTLAQIREDWISEMITQTQFWEGIPEDKAESLWSRALAAHDREVAAKTLREAAQIVQDTARQGGGLQTAEGALHREADRIESQANEKGDDR